MTLGAGALADPVAEGRRVVEAAQHEHVPIGLLGGVGIALHQHADLPDALRRRYADIDLAVDAGADRALRDLLAGLGYEADRRFNALHGHKRQLWWDHANERQLDVFVGRFAMCHALPLEARLDDPLGTLRPADLLLTKLQVVELNPKDVVDALAILDQHEVAPETAGDVIGHDRIAAITGADWGWATTAGDTLDKLADRVSVAPADRQTVLLERIAAVRAAIDGAPKSLRWRARARLGRRMPWYELPEEHVR